MQSPTLLADISLIVAIVVGLVGLWRGWWDSPAKREERAKAAADRELNQSMALALLGRAEIPDHAGGVLVPKEPGLVDRVTNVEATLVKLDQFIELVTDVRSRLNDHETRISEHDTAIAALIATTYKDGADSALRAEELRHRGVVEGEKRS